MDIQDLFKQEWNEQTRAELERLLTEEMRRELPEELYPYFKVVVGRDEQEEAAFWAEHEAALIALQERLAQAQRYCDEHGFHPFSSA